MACSSNNMWEAGKSQQQNLKRAHMKYKTQYGMSLSSYSWYQH
jgi:hypothetical protein